MECLELQGIPGLRMICIILKAAVKNICTEFSAECFYAKDPENV